MQFTKSRMVAGCVLLLAILSVLSGPWSVAEDNKWEPVGVFDGVTVSRMEIPGRPLFAFRGEIVAPIHIGTLMATFVDGSERKNWVDRYAMHEQLEKTEEWSETYWIRFGLPFPISDRDYVLRFEAERDAQNRRVTSIVKSVESSKKGPQDCCLRAVVENTFYQFEAIPGREKTRLIVEVRTDPKGLLPSWLVNLIQKKWPSKTLSGLVRASKANGKMHPAFADWHKP